MTNFDQYTDATLSALKLISKPQEAIAKKNEILQEIYSFHNLTPTSVLFVGFSPAILACQSKQISVTEISEKARDYLKEKGIKFNYISYTDLGEYTKKFDAVVAFDEYFTFADSDQQQQNQISLFCNLAREFVISTLKDYKNQDFKDREFSHPALIRSGSDLVSFLEIHDWDFKDRANWKTWVHEIHDPADSMTSWGSFSRRTMYFKQLAKFSMDAGASDYLVHRNLMYKSLIKKNYEHVISIRFDNGY
jgi:hypothetical protein